MVNTYAFFERLINSQQSFPHYLPVILILSKGNPHSFPTTTHHSTVTIHLFLNLRTCINILNCYNIL